MKRTLRHPIRGDRLHPKPSTRPARQSSWRADARQPRMRPRKSVNVASIVGSPEEEESRPNLRLRIVGVIVLLLFGVLVLRLWTLQVVEGKTYAANVTRNQVRVVSVPAPRGEIVDRNGTVLVSNTPQEEILLSRAEAAQNPSIVGMVAALVGETPKQVQASVNNVQYSPYEPVPVATGVSTATVQFLQTHQSEYPGVSVETVAQRTYPQGGTTGTQILGYVGDISSTYLAAHPNEGYTQGSQIGVSGIEAQYEPYLRGVAGRQALSVDASGNVVGTLELHRAADRRQRGAQHRHRAPADGRDRPAEPDPHRPEDGRRGRREGPAGAQRRRHRDEPPERPGPRAGLLPELRPQRVGRRHLAGQLHRAATERRRERRRHRRPLHAGLDLQAGDGHRRAPDGLITPSYSYDDTGTFKIDGCPAPGVTQDTGCVLHDDPGDSGGVYNITGALTVSSDSFFYKLGEMFWEQQGQYGQTPIQNEATAYGEGTITGIDLPGEAQGWVDSYLTRAKLHAEAPKAFPYAASWHTGDNIEMAFGQGETVLTPIEQAVAYSTFANYGAPPAAVPATRRRWPPRSSTP